MASVDAFNDQVRLNVALRDRGYRIGGVPLPTRMSSVWMGERIADSLPVVVKSYRPERSKLHHVEVKAFTAIGGHPAILKLLDYRDPGPAASPGFLILERGNGDLSGLAGGIPLAPRDAVAAILGPVRALVHIHDSDYVHKDFKPSNIIRVGDTWKLGDLGLAEPISPSWGGGTPDVEHPIQTEARRGFTPKQLDIHTVGNSLHLLLTGRCASVWRRSCGLLTPPPSHYAPAVDRVLDSIVLACIHPNPQYAFRRAADLAEALAAYAEGRRPEMVPREPRFARAMRLIRVGTVPVVCAAVVAVLSISIQATHHAETLQLDTVSANLESLSRQAEAERCTAEGLIAEARPALKSCGEVLLGGKNPADVDGLSEQRASGSEKARQAMAHAKRAVSLSSQMPTDERGTQLRSLAAGVSDQASQLLGSYLELDADLATIRKLDMIRTDKALSLKLRSKDQRSALYQFEKSARQYAETFRDRLQLDFGSPAFDPAANGRRLESRPGRHLIAAALTDSAYTSAAGLGLRMMEEPAKFVFDVLLGGGRASSKDARRIEMTRQLAERLDSRDPWTVRFHQAFRTVAPWEVGPKFSSLAADADIMTVPTSRLSMVAEVLWDSYSEDELKTGPHPAATLLRRARSIHPHDFWINHFLAEMTAGTGEELGFRRAAQEARPDSAAACFALAEVLRREGRWRDVEDEVRHLYDEAVRFDPSLKDRIPNPIEPPSPHYGSSPRKN